MVKLDYDAVPKVVLRRSGSRLPLTLSDPVGEGTEFVNVHRRGDQVSAYEPATAVPEEVEDRIGIAICWLHSRHTWKFARCIEKERA